MDQLSSDVLSALFGLRDPVSALSHFLAAVMGLLAHWYLTRVMRRSDLKPGRRIEIHVFGAAVILVFTASGLYHAAPDGSTQVEFFKRIDHASIFVLIAATTTAIIGIRPGRWGRPLAVVAWIVAGLGLSAQLLAWPSVPAVSGGTYVLACFLALGSLGCLIQERSRVALLPLVAGALLYTLGAAVYLMDRFTMWPGFIHGHEVFHLLVIGGAGSHYVFVLGHLKRLPDAAKSPGQARAPGEA